MNPTEQPNTPPQAPPEDIFVIKQGEKKPLDKKAIIFVVIITFLGIVLLVGVLIFALIKSADGVAGDFRQKEAVQVKKTDAPLADLEPGAVINQRNLDELLKQVAANKQAQPELDNVLFAAGWSQQYQDAIKLQIASRQDFKNITTYGGQLKQLLSFDTTVQSIFDQDPDLAALINPKDSFTIRSLSGSYQDLAKTIQNTASPPQIADIKKQLVTIYTDKSAAYLTWATRLEQNNPKAAADAQQTITQKTTDAATATDDKKYVAAFTPSYKKLVKQHQSLSAALGRN